jgi:glycerate kinase
VESAVILVAPDAFKNSMSASRAAEVIEDGLEKARDDENWSVRRHPLADGGEGTTEAFVEAHDGNYQFETVTGPLGSSVEARWGTFGPEDRNGVIEMAQASGHELLDESEMDPLRATTYGTGELIESALDRGVETLYVGVGGSATVDGGLGMARALGFRFLDDRGNIVRRPGKLADLDRIDDGDVDLRLSDFEIVVCCDVDNPLLGSAGAARVFAPQKGAATEDVERLEHALSHWADVVERTTGRTRRNQDGAGAAGGLAFGLTALLGAELRSGAGCVMDETNFNSALSSADVLITGEGSLDAQSLRGKTPLAAARRAREQSVDFVLGLAGQLDGDRGEFHPAFDLLFSAITRPMDLREALERGPCQVREAAREVGYLLKLIDRW